MTTPCVSTQQVTPCASSQIPDITSPQSASSMLLGFVIGDAAINDNLMPTDISAQCAIMMDHLAAGLPAADICRRLSGWALGYQPRLPQLDCAICKSIMSDTEFTACPSMVAHRHALTEYHPCNMGILRCTPLAALPILPLTMVKLTIAYVTLTDLDLVVILASISYVITLGLLADSTATTADDIDVIVYRALAACTHECVADILHISAADISAAHALIVAAADRAYNGVLDIAPDAHPACECISVIMFVMCVIKTAILTNRRPSYKKVITRIKAAGGLTSANCAIAGAVLGARGISDKEWLAHLYERGFIENSIGNFVAAVSQDHISISTSS